MRFATLTVAMSSTLLLMACQTPPSSGQNGSVSQGISASQLAREAKPAAQGFPQDPSIKAAAFRYLDCMAEVGREARSDKPQPVHGVVHGAEQICNAKIKEMEKALLIAGANRSYADGTIESIAANGRSVAAEYYLNGTLKRR
jgi:hypothetical protein